MPPLFIPATFASKKAKILQDLSVPASEYRDKSPKGSVDEGIRELIDEINACDGLVTTSSCAGRISLFLEGNGKVAGLDREKDEIAGSKVPGGKGGGEFLFVSHDPVNVSEGGVLHQLHKILDLSDSFDERRYGIEVRFRDPDQRFVRLAFEPMILHVMAASLHHARPVLNAAFNSGFRESGVQSLKNLDDPESCPMVAVRTAGLGLEAIIASVTSEVEDSPRRFHCLVSREYIALILKTANERFEANKQRIDKFRDSLKEAMASEIRKLQQKEKWESPEARRQRKRQEGLRAQEIQKMTASREMQDGTQFPSEHDQGYIQLYLDN